VQRKRVAGEVCQPPQWANARTLQCCLLLAFCLCLHWLTSRWLLQISEKSHPTLRHVCGLQHASLSRVKSTPHPRAHGAPWSPLHTIRCDGTKKGKLPACQELVYYDCDSSVLACGAVPVVDVSPSAMQLVSVAKRDRDLRDIGMTFLVYFYLHFNSIQLCSIIALV